MPRSESGARSLLQQIQQIRRGLEMFQHDLGLAIAVHADLDDFDLGRFRGREENVIVRGIFRVLEELRDEMAAEMVAAASRDVHRAEHLFILDVAA